MSPPFIVSALTTAFASDGSLDRGATRALMVHVAHHVDAVMLPGTTGEFPALSAAERTEVIADAIKLLGADKVIAHVGAPSTQQAVALLRAAQDAGARRFAAITPHFLAASCDLTRAHYAALRAACNGELIAYVYPEVAATQVSPSLMAQLATEGVDGAKLSGSPAGRVEEYIEAAPAGFPIWSGSDGEFPRVMRAGGAGVVSGVSGVVPSMWARLRDAWQLGDLAGLEEAQVLATELVSALGKSITCLKYGLDCLQLPGGSPRLAIDPPTAAQRAAIDRALAHAAATLASPRVS